MPRKLRVRLFTALRWLRSFVPAFLPYRTPAQLAALPWQEAKALALWVALIYRWRSSQGLWLLLCLLCQAPLWRLVTRHPEATIGELTLLLREGALWYRTPWGYAASRLRREQRRAARPLPDLPAPEASSPLEQITALDTFGRLDPEDRLILEAAVLYSREELATLWGCSMRAVDNRIWRARERLKKYL